jgi:hypothetical protein
VGHDSFFEQANSEIRHGNTPSLGFTSKLALDLGRYFERKRHGDHLVMNAASPLQRQLETHAFRLLQRRQNARKVCRRGTPLRTQHPHETLCGIRVRFSRI